MLNCGSPTASGPGLPASTIDHFSRHSVVVFVTVLSSSSVYFSQEKEWPRVAKAWTGT